MLHLKRLLRVIHYQLAHITWPILTLFLAIHASLSFLLLSKAGEHQLLHIERFIYYYIVTTSTVGYGDFSPQTPQGKLVVALFQIPLGLALFGAFLGKTGQTINIILRRNMTGQKTFTALKDHILIFGWHPHRTPKIIDNILGDKNRYDRMILLCVKHEIQHPFNDDHRVEFARLESFTDYNQLQRVGINGAGKIIVDTDDDNDSLTVTLRISKLVNQDCHISTHLNDEVKAQMLREHCDNVEASSSHSIQMLVRSIQDPGSSLVQEQLLSTLKGDTQFSLMIPSQFVGIEYLALFEQFKRVYQATIIGIANERNGQGLEINPPNQKRITGGQIIHYIAADRLHDHDINWDELTGDLQLS